MKRILPIGIVLILCVASASAQLNIWRWQNPLPAGNMLHSVQMVSYDVAYACGENGTFIRTSDAGTTWDLQTNLLKFKTIFNSLSFFDRNYGMICGDSGHILKTTNSGTTWKSVGIVSKEKFNSIVVIDTNISLIVTMGGGILKTTNGGSSWFMIAVEDSYALYSINKLRPDFLTITGYAGVLLKSVDTGRSWQHIPLPFGNTFFNGRFTNDSIGTIIGDQGLIVHTTDGGKTWVKQTLSGNSIITASMNVIDGKDPNVYAIAGDHGTILYTADAGATWQQSDIGSLDAVKSVSFFDKLTATAVGKDGIILRTTDGGATWEYQPHKPFTDLLRAVAFPKGDTSLGLAVGELGTILRTSDGGKTWALIESGFSRRLRGVSFMDSSSVIAVGDNGGIIKSTDGGLTWNPQVSSTTQNLYSVSFATAMDGLVVGDNNTVLKTYTAGQFWTREFIMPPSRPPWLLPIDYFNCVSYPDKSHAFITGFHAYYASTDGGVNWKFTVIDPQDTGIQIVNRDTMVLPVDVFHGISFADSLHGAIINSLGTDGMPIPQWYARFTSDGGLTWIVDRTPDDVHLNTIQCVDPKHSTVVGRGGYIGHTSDGGITLNQQQSNTLNNLFGVCFGTLKAGTAVGNRGNIIRITTNEKNLSVSERGASGTPKIIIDANYPNPFSLFTTISYHLPVSGFTTIEIYSVGGNRIVQLANEYQSSGDYSIRFDAESLASGSYLCRICSNEICTVAKLTIAR